MFDGPSFGDLPAEYHCEVSVPLSQGKGVAAFPVVVQGRRFVLYAAYEMGDKTRETAEDERAFLRAAQAIAIQREARVAARQGGYEAETA